MNKILFLILPMISFVSCASVPMEKKTLDGLVYDEQNVPVSGVSVFYNDVKIAETDLYGHFYSEGISFLPDDKLSFHKGGYETVNLNLSLSSYPSLVYVTVESLESIIEKTASLIKVYDIQDAEKNMKRLINADKSFDEKVRTAVLECALLFKEKKYADCSKKAREYLELYENPVFEKIAEKAE